MPIIYEDGQATIVGCELKPNIKLYETEVTPPGIEGGDAIPLTTMRNVALETSAPQKLKSYTGISFTAAYDQTVYADCDAIVNKNQRWTVTFPDNFKITFWGFLKTFQPNGNSKGNRPLANVVIHQTNRDAAGVESAPVFTAS